MATISGTVKDKDGYFAKRLVRLFRKDTGQFIGETLSNATTGAYSITTPSAAQCFAVCYDYSDPDDPYYSSVTALLTMNDTGLSDTKGHTVTKYGTVARSSTQTKFGGYSAYFDNSDSYLAIPSTSDFAFGTGDFTAEFWVWLTTISGTDTLVDFRPGANGAYFIMAQTDGTLSYGVNSTTPISVASAVSASTWMHIAAARSGTSLKVFVDGTQIGSTATDTTNYATAPLLIGKNVFSAGLDLGGYIAEFRVTKGVARYTSNFTVPTTPFLNYPAATEIALILEDLTPA